MQMLKVQRFGRSVYVVDTSVGDLRHGHTIYGHQLSTQREARDVSDGLCAAIASGLPRDKLSIAADIDKQRQE